jgi:hypothetical protein
MFTGVPKNGILTHRKVIRRVLGNPGFPKKYIIIILYL